MYDTLFTRDANNDSMSFVLAQTMRDRQKYTTSKTLKKGRNKLQFWRESETGFFTICRV